MSAYHHTLVVEAFRANDDHLTEGQLATVGGRWWKRVVHDMRKAGYVLIEEASGDWYLEGVPDLDAGRAVDREPPEVPCPSAGSPGPAVDGSPDVEAGPIALFSTEPERPGHYVEAA